MAQQQPAVVMIARHGMRMDAADSSWHLNTPTPYDPPLTYGGWNQCRQLGVRIASLLHAREEEALNADGGRNEGVGGQDFARLDNEKPNGDERPKKRRRIKHKVVLHTSPFLRCLQTSVAIASGMAQYDPDGGSSKNKQHSGIHSPKVHPQEGARASPKLAPLPDAKHDFAHAIARKALQHHRHRKCKLRVDAFLGEWLNPGYFESITPPPPSNMMVATAKAELMQNENVEVFTPSGTSKAQTGSNSLWGGGNAEQGKSSSNEGSLDGLKVLGEGLPPSPTSPKSPNRSRASTLTESGRKSPSHRDRTLQPLTSTVPKQEAAIYHPPKPQYAVSASSQIPRGYFAHARNACVNVDYSWDSSRPPQDWGDGGEFGEEWSAMHRRTRRGFNGLIKWYNSHSADHSNEDALGFEAPPNEDLEEQEDLVVILVTHGAGCNALIGALTGQPVLLDVGMASLTMAVRKQNAPPLTILASEYGPDGTETPNPHHHSTRRGSMDMGLSSVYDMQLVASSAHMHPSAYTTTSSPALRPQDTSLDRRQNRRPDEPPRSNTSSALGTIRRPTPSSAAGKSADRSNSLPPNRLPASKPSTPGRSTGLWTPPSQASQSPGLSPFMSPAMAPVAEKEIEKPEGEMVLEPSEHEARERGEGQDGKEAEEAEEKVGELPRRPGLGPRAESQGLWGGSTPERKRREVPKRRWTVDQD